MNDKQRALYQKICAFSLDDAESAFTFTQRLARENGWTLAYARRVADEYKRFMLLAAVAGHVVTPSEDVDQVWHLHLAYTRSYWEEFCGAVLGKPIHHGPTKGGTSEQAKYLDCYERTKESYEQFFGEAPPADIWPAADARFGEDLHWRRVNTDQNWVIPKPWRTAGNRHAGHLFAACLPIFGATAMLDVPLFWVLVIAVVVIGAIWALLVAPKEVLAKDAPAAVALPVDAVAVAGAEAVEVVAAAEGNPRTLPRPGLSRSSDDSALRQL